jgi:hypothetical protein
MRFSRKDAKAQSNALGWKGASQLADTFPDLCKLTPRENKQSGKIRVCAVIHAATCLQSSEFDLEQAIFSSGQEGRGRAVDDCSTGHVAHKAGTHFRIDPRNYARHCYARGGCGAFITCRLPDSSFKQKRFARGIMQIRRAIFDQLRSSVPARRATSWNANTSGFEVGSLSSPGRLASRER